MWNNLRRSCFRHRATLSSRQVESTLAVGSKISLSKEKLFTSNQYIYSKFFSYKNYYYEICIFPKLSYKIYHDAISESVVCILSHSCADGAQPSLTLVIDKNSFPMLQRALRFPCMHRICAYTGLRKNKRLFRQATLAFYLWGLKTPCYCHELFQERALYTRSCSCFISFDLL